MAARCRPLLLATARLAVPSCRSCAVVRRQSVSYAACAVSAAWRPHRAGPAVRCHSTGGAGGDGESEVFNRAKKRQHKNTAGLLSDSADYDYLRDEVAARLVDRLNDITREFPVAADIGANNGSVLRALDGHGEIQTLYMMDMAENMLLRDSHLFSPDANEAGVRVVPVVADEEYVPFGDHTLDAALSCLSLHWVNDLPGTLAQVRRALRPDGVFIGAMIGGDSLGELRSAFLAAEMERDGGMSPHVSPMVQVADAGSLLGAAGFTMPTVDVDNVVIEYPSPEAVMHHMRSMGEGNAVAERRGRDDPELRARAAAKYAEMYANEDGSVPATFQVIYMIGWAPHESQPAPLRRGSAQKSMAEFAHTAVVAEPPVGSTP